MLRDLEGREEYDAEAASREADRRVYGWESVEGDEGKCGGVYTVSVKNGQQKRESYSMVVFLIILREES